MRHVSGVARPSREDGEGGVKRDQTAEVRRRLFAGMACGRQLYFDAIPNGRTRAREIARRMGRVLVSEPCVHHTSDDPAYRDYRLDLPRLFSEVA